jgi:hypothetical protein
MIRQGAVGWAQSLYPKQFADLMDAMRMIAPAIGRTIA